MEPWTGAQRAFAVNAFYNNGDSFVIAQRVFQIEFGIHRNRAVPSAHAIKTCVRNFEATGSTLKKKGGSVKTVRTPENIAVVREAIERSPHRPARRHSVSGCLKPAFDGFFTKIFTSYPYKIQVTRALHQRDNVNRVFCQTFFKFEIHAERSQKCHRFCKTLSQQKHLVLQSTNLLNIKRFKDGSKLALAESLSLWPNQKSSVVKSPDSLTHPVLLALDLFRENKRL